MLTNSSASRLAAPAGVATRLLALHPAPPPQRHLRFCFLSSQNARLLPSVDARLDVLEQGRVEDARGVHPMDEGVGLLDELQARRLHLVRRVAHGGDAGALLAQRRRVAVLVVSGVQLRTRPMGSRSDACRSDAEGYPHLMASTATGAASRGARLSQRNSGTRALGDAAG